MKPRNTAVYNLDKQKTKEDEKRVAKIDIFDDLLKQHFLEIIYSKDKVAQEGMAKCEASI